MWYNYTLECYSSVKNNDIMKFVAKWMELEKITLRAGMQTKKEKHGIYLLIGVY